ncbi:SDR family NAD(P)-dependent oxidoreductase [Actinoplanes awajinensis]|uniref:SDR family NAD(P)-dependent oxidoreductase n=1 Tax=Actinoplanes awajinensis TaxID=135946 RepID=UPI000A8B1EB6|nr:SDR family oxidoreductase [Actinoplanes awajinensis]
MGDDYQGRTALVTGASKGLGRAYAMELARRGSRVVLLARSEPELHALAAEIRARHGGTPAEVITGDLSAPDGPQRVLHELRDRGLTIDLLLNNAGAGITGPFLQRAIEPQLRTVGLNVAGLLALTHAIGAEMVARGAGGIINVSSNGAFQPVPYQASYAATKAFVLSFTEALAEELRGTGVHVMATHPGATATGFFDGSSVTMDPGADNPETVAGRTLDDYSRRRGASYPGRTATRVMTWAARLLPRTTVARIAGSFSRRQQWHHAVDTA